MKKNPAGLFGPHVAEVSDNDMEVYCNVEDAVLTIVTEDQNIQNINQLSLKDVLHWMCKNHPMEYDVLIDRVERHIKTEDAAKG